jgi:hypothetical protein
MTQMKINIAQFFDRKRIDEIAKEVGFVERKSPITGTAFLLALTTGTLGSTEGTLAELALFLGVTCRVDVTAQAVDARFTDAAVVFLERCLRQGLAVLRSGAHRMKALSQFDHVYAMDSTNFDLNPELATVFKGNGGDASKAAMRIQFVLDFCTGSMYFEVGDVTLSDPTALASLIRDKKIPMDGCCLFLTDLGYFKAATFSEMCGMKGVLFLSKMHFGSKVHRPDGTEINLDEKLKKKPLQFEELISLAGATCRLIGVRLDDETAGQRIRKANAASEAKSGQISTAYRLFLHYAIFVTSLPKPYTMELLYVLYRIRWQVELVFKSWKSVFGIHKQRSGKEARVRCEVYGKLIVATLAALMECVVMTACDDISLSRYKVAKVLKSTASALSMAILTGRTTIMRALDLLQKVIRKHCRKAKQKNKPTIEQRLEAVFGGKRPNGRYGAKSLA